MSVFFSLYYIVYLTWHGAFVINDSYILIVAFCMGSVVATLGQMWSVAIFTFRNCWPGVQMEEFYVIFAKQLLIPQKEY